MSDVKSMTKTELFYLAGSGGDLRSGLLQAKKEGLDVNDREYWDRSLLYEAAYHGCAHNIAELIDGAGKEVGFNLINQDSSFSFLFQAVGFKTIKCDTSSSEHDQTVLDE